MQRSRQLESPNKADIHIEAPRGPQLTWERQRCPFGVFGGAEQSKDLLRVDETIGSEAELSISPTPIPASTARAEICNYSSDLHFATYEQHELAAPLYHTLNRFKHFPFVIIF